MLLFNKVGNILKQSARNQITSRCTTLNSALYPALRYMSSSKVYVGGLSYVIDDTSLRQAFAPYGQVVEAKVVLDRENRSRRFGFVTYSSAEAASSAIQALDGRDIHGNKVRVNYATDKAPQTSNVGNDSGGAGLGNGDNGYGGSSSYRVQNYGVGSDGGGNNYGGSSYDGGQNYRGNSDGYPPSGASSASRENSVVVSGVCGNDSYFGGGAHGSHVTVDSGLGRGSKDLYGNNFNDNLRSCYGGGGVSGGHIYGDGGYGGGQHYGENDGGISPSGHNIANGVGVARVGGNNYYFDGLTHNNNFTGLGRISSCQFDNSSSDGLGSGHGPHGIGQNTGGDGYGGGQNHIGNNGGYFHAGQNIDSVGGFARGNYGVVSGVVGNDSYFSGAAPGHDVTSQTVLGRGPTHFNFGGGIYCGNCGCFIPAVLKTTSVRGLGGVNNGHAGGNYGGVGRVVRNDSYSGGWGCGYVGGQNYYGGNYGRGLTDPYGNNSIGVHGGGQTYGGGGYGGGQTYGGGGGYGGVQTYGACSYGGGQTYGGGGYGGVQTYGAGSYGGGQTYDGGQTYGGGSYGGVQTYGAGSYGGGQTNNGNIGDYSPIGWNTRSVGGVAGDHNVSGGVGSNDSFFGGGALSSNVQNGSSRGLVDGGLGSGYGMGQNFSGGYSPSEPSANGGGIGGGNYGVPGGHGGNSSYWSGGAPEINATAQNGFGTADQFGSNYGFLGRGYGGEQNYRGNNGYSSIGRNTAGVGGFAGGKYSGSGIGGYDSYSSVCAPGAHVTAQSGLGTGSTDQFGSSSYSGLRSGFGGGQNYGGCSYGRGQSYVGDTGSHSPSGHNPENVEGVVEENYIVTGAGIGNNSPFGGATPSNIVTSQTGLSRGTTDLSRSNHYGGLDNGFGRGQNYGGDAHGGGRSYSGDSSGCSPSGQNTVNVGGVAGGNYVVAGGNYVVAGEGDKNISHFACAPNDNVTAQTGLGRDSTDHRSSDYGGLGSGFGGGKNYVGDHYGRRQNYRRNRGGYFPSGPDIPGGKCGTVEGISGNNSKFNGGDSRNNVKSDTRFCSSALKDISADSGDHKSSSALEGKFDEDEPKLDPVVREEMKQSIAKIKANLEKHIQENGGLGPDIGDFDEKNYKDNEPPREINPVVREELKKSIAKIRENLENIAKSENNNNNDGDNVPLLENQLALI